MVVHGLPNTVGVTLEMMILHGQAVMRGAERAMVVVDMPFGSYEASAELAYRQRRARAEGNRRAGREGRSRRRRCATPSLTWSSAAFRSWAMSACGPRR